MKKLVVNEDNYKRIVLKRMIIVCWILLAICFGIKLFGGNFFSIVCTNETYIRVCDYIQNTFWYWVLSFIFFYTSNLLFLLALYGKYKFTKKQLLIISLYLLIMYPIKCVFQIYDIQYVGFILDLSIVFVIPFILKVPFWKQCLGFVLYNGFLLISMFIKNMGLVFIDQYVVSYLIFLIDFYIMLVLYYLYSNLIREKKEG